MTLPQAPTSHDGRWGLQRALAYVATQLEDIPGLTLGFGRKAISQQDAPPRVVWVPTTDEFGAERADSTNPEAKGTRWAGVEAHVWGKTEDLCEALVHRVWLAFHAAARTSARGFAGAWITEQERHAGWSRLGAVYVLSLQLAIPLVIEPYPETVMDDVPTAPPTDTDGTLQFPEP